MAIDTSRPVNNPAPLAAAAANPKGAMGKDAFMKLLVAELKNQDPMNPMESRDMIAQLSQLTSVEKLSGIDEKLSGLQQSQNVSGAIQNAGLIGRKVTADTISLSLTSAGNAKGRYELAGSADTVSVTIRDADGEIVRKVDMGKQAFGPKTFEWDGTANNGMRAPNGTYTFEVVAKTANGARVAATSRVTGLVTGVSYESGAPEVIVGNTRVPLGDVVSIAQ